MKKTDIMFQWSEPDGLEKLRTKLIHGNKSFIERMSIKAFIWYCVIFLILHFRILDNYRDSDLAWPLSVMISILTPFALFAVILLFDYITKSIQEMKIQILKDKITFGRDNSSQIQIGYKKIRKIVFLEGSYLGRQITALKIFFKKMKSPVVFIDIAGLKEEWSLAHWVVLPIFNLLFIPLIIIGFYQIMQCTNSYTFEQNYLCRKDDLNRTDKLDLYNVDRIYSKSEYLLIVDKSKKKYVIYHQLIGYTQLVDTIEKVSGKSVA